MIDGMKYSVSVYSYMAVIFLSTAVASVFKLVSVDGVSTIKCAVEHQLLVSMEQMTISYKFVTHNFESLF